MATETETMSIVNGPSKYDLMLGLFEGREVEFTLRYAGLSNRPVDHAVRARTISIEREDGSNESWMISFYVGIQRFHGHFSTRDRKGWIRPA